MSEFTESDLSATQLRSSQDPLESRLPTTRSSSPPGPVCMTSFVSDEQTIVGTVVKPSARLLFLLCEAQNDVEKQSWARDGKCSDSAIFLRKLFGLPASCFLACIKRRASSQISKEPAARATGRSPEIIGLQLRPASVQKLNNSQKPSRQHEHRHVFRCCRVAGNFRSCQVSEFVLPVRKLVHLKEQVREMSADEAHNAHCNH